MVEGTVRSRTDYNLYIVFYFRFNTIYSIDQDISSNFGFVQNLEKQHNTLINIVILSVIKKCNDVDYTQLMCIFFRHCIHSLFMPALLAWPLPIAVPLVNKSKGLMQDIRILCCQLRRVGQMASPLARAFASVEQTQHGLDNGA